MHFSKVSPNANPKVSVIIPAHNEAKIISPTLTALLAQDYPDFEVIVIDNASSDNTSEVARTFPITVVSESRKGTMWACERGRQEAKGEIIVRMDADCTPAKDWLTRGVAHFQNPKVSAVTGPYDYMDKSKVFQKVSLVLQRYMYAFSNSLFQLLGMGALLIGGNSFMRGSALQNVGGFNTAIVFYGDDTDTAKRMSTQGKVVFDPDLTLPTSARRFTNEGTISLCAKYFFHFFKVIFTRAPKTS